MSLSRRSLLAFLAAAGATAAAGWRRAASATVDLYDGRALVDSPMLVGHDWTITGVTIAAGGVLEFDPAASVTVSSTGNVVVEEGGTLRMRPASAAQTHRLQFVNVNEAAFVGGGMAVLATDVGLWAPHGTLDLVGSPKAGWNRTGTDPTWTASDEIVRAPQAVGDFTTFAPHVIGSAVPTVTGPDGAHPTEVLNLTRNVIIGGTPGHRAHVMLMHHDDGDTEPGECAQTIRFVRIEHVGPRKLDAASGKTKVVLGRYGLHFHQCGDGTRGSLVEGVAIVNCGSRGFVPHNSHGITFRDCVAYNIGGHAYWWDTDDTTTYPANATHDTLLDHCGAFKVSPATAKDSGSPDEYRLTGFQLGQGVGNTARDCVAAGVYNFTQQQSSGFFWPESANMVPNVWTFTDNVAHNVQKIGLFIWQNDPTQINPHQVVRPVAYRCGEAGIVHGAYINGYQFTGGVLFGNGSGGTPKASQLFIHPGRHNTFTDFRCDAQGVCDYALTVGLHQAAVQGDPLTVLRANLTGHRIAPIDYQSTDKVGWVDFVSCTVGTRDLEPSDIHITAMLAAETVRGQRRDDTAWQLRSDGTSVAIPAFV